ncbi:MAG: zf-HC2 domain-containing protein [Nitrospiraceae bacterium]
MKDHPSQWIASGLTCRQVTAKATLYLEDQSSLFTTIRIGLHLASCADCRIYIKQMALVTEAVASLPKCYPSPVNRLRLRQQYAAQMSR